MKILLTCVGGGLSPEVIRFFQKSKIYKNTKVYGVDMDRNASGKHFADFFQTVSSGNSKYFIQQISKICKKHKINLVVPGSDEDALNLSKNRKKIEIGKTKIACISYESLKILSNKSKTYKFLKRLNFPLPLWFEATNQKELFKYINLLIFKKKDVVIKPSVSRGGRNVYIVSKGQKSEIFSNEGRHIKLNINTLKKKYLKKIKKNYPVIVMEKLNNPSFDFDMLCKNGQLIKGVARRRVNPTVPNDGHYIEERSDIYKIGEKLAKCLKLSWLYDCDFMIDDKKKPQIIEINPRMSGSAAVSVAAGIPLLDDLISIYKNKKIKPNKKIKKKIILPSKSLFLIKDKNKG